MAVPSPPAAPCPIADPPWDAEAVIVTRLHTHAAPEKIPNSDTAYEPQPRLAFHQRCEGVRRGAKGFLDYPSKTSMFSRHTMVNSICEGM